MTPPQFLFQGFISVIPTHQFHGHVGSWWQLVAVQIGNSIQYENPLHLLQFAKTFNIIITLFSLYHTHLSASAVHYISTSV